MPRRHSPAGSDGQAGHMRGSAYIYADIADQKIMFFRTYADKREKVKNLQVSLA
jgi:hypothetical protein